MKPLSNMATFKMAAIPLWLPKCSTEAGNFHTAGLFFSCKLQLALLKKVTPGESQDALAGPRH